MRLPAAICELKGGTPPAPVEADESGRVALPLPTGRHRLEASFADHRSISFWVDLEDAAELPMTVWLDPFSTPPQPRDDAVDAGAPAGNGLIHGFAYSADSGLPLAGAVVTLEQRGVGGVTDADGYFRLMYPLEAFAAEEMPPTDTLLVDVDGRVRLQHQGILLTGCATEMLLDIAPGELLVTEPPAHKLLRPDEPAQMELRDEPQEPLAPEDVSRALDVIDPPATIRVGTGCSCTTCTGGEVMSLETYVRRGLNNEWISGWDGDSLRAGAIAYRSYGVWYVEHPLGGSYDICDNTCCQAYDATTSSSTDAAVNATAGFLLERGGAVFRSEYSAEDNAWDDPGDPYSCSNADLSCGDGFAGSPATSWPCLSDSPCAGHGCFGHGRGMCQWGTQRWASTQGKAWPWIIDHYYNAEGTGSGLRTACMTTPMWVDAAWPEPAVVEPGTTFTIQVTATNGAELTHGLVLIGASLYSTATGYISDPPHDQQVALAPGSNQVSRLFDVPAGTPDGSYDLLVSLYYDVNGDGAITTADKNLVLVRDYGVLTVAPSLSISGTAVGEGHRDTSQAVLAVTLSYAPSGTVSVDWSTADGSAYAGEDYGAAAGNLSFTPATQSRTVEVTVLGDYLVEGNEAFTVSLANPVGATIATGQATVAITDDDTTPCDAAGGTSLDAADLAETVRAIVDLTYEPPGNPDCTQDGAVNGGDVEATVTAIFAS